MLCIASPCFALPSLGPRIALVAWGLALRCHASIIGLLSIALPSPFLASLCQDFALHCFAHRIALTRASSCFV
jgi:hypothetical protein